jgi:hypothetical protein
MNEGFQGEKSRLDHDTTKKSSESKPCQGSLFES